MLFALTLACTAACTVATPMTLGDDVVRLTLLPKGGMAKIGYYAPQRATFSAEKPAAVKKVPSGVDAPRFGVIAFGAGPGVTFLIDEPDDKPAKLYVDSNGNGEFADDEAAEWGTDPKKGGNMYSGAAKLDLGEKGKPNVVHLSMYRFDKDDPAREELKSTLLYYRDYAYEGEVALGGKKYRAILSDDLARGDFRGKAPSEPKEGEKASDEGSGVTLLLDVNGNGKFDVRGENFDVRKPFNIGGTTFEIAEMSRDGSTFRVVKSKQSVAEIPTPPDHSVGKTITAFEAKDTDGKPVAFPADFKGKVVLLDFWATWCGPCMKEMPNVVAAYEKYHGQGFEVLGVSLDNEKTVERMAEVMGKAKMTWRQIADGKGWKAEIAQNYVVSSIPATFLVDGTTGRILGANLRGAKLDEAIEKALGAGQGKPAK